MAAQAEKVLFFPYYFYLHYEPFRRVIARLSELGFDAHLVYMPCSPMDESERFGLTRMRRDGCPVKELSIHNVGLGSTSLHAKVIRFAGLVLSRQRIERFLRTERPHLIVVGSDLGNSYFRLLLDLCRRLKIPVLILATVDSWPAPYDMSSVGSSAVPHWISPLLHWFELESIPFQGWVYGSYHREAFIAVVSQRMKDQLVANGISAERIAVTGNPYHDLLHEVQKQPRNEFRERIWTRLGWPPHGRLTAYCTERIQDIYGESYLDRLNTLLVKTFDELPDECRIVVKLHPKECQKSLKQFAQLFSGDRYRVVQDVDVHHLARGADLIIGHFSSTLIDAALLGTPVLSINIAGDRSRLIFGPDLDVLYITSEAQLRAKIYNVLYDQAFLASVQSSLSEWRAQHGLKVDGRSADRVARLIQSLVKGSVGKK